jgi:sensor histidine kinase YesM
LQPHFLFNTLQGISTLIHRDPTAADETLAKLSDLLREVLRHRDHVFVTLEDEIRFTRTFLEISQIRFGHRLQYEILVPPALLNASVPLFILQPLVENALAHGIGARAKGGHVAITATRTGNRLLLEVTDDGAGIDRAGRDDGIGLRNTRERLLASYATDAAFTVGPAAGGGTVARLDLPFRAFASVAPRA